MSKITFLLFFCLLYGNVLLTQETWKESMPASQLIPSVETPYWLLEKTEVDLTKRAFSSEDTWVNNDYTLGRYFADCQGYNIEIILLKNTAFETLSRNFHDDSVQDIIRGFNAANLHPSRYTITDSVSSLLDLEYGSDVAIRKVLFKVYRIKNFEKGLHTLDSLYFSKNRRQLLTFIRKASNEAVTAIPKELEQYKLPDLMDVHHQKYLKKRWLKEHAVLPASYPVELGAFKHESVEEEKPGDLIFDAYDYVEEQVYKKFILDYKPQLSDRDIIYIDKGLESMLKLYLGYEFHYDIKDSLFSNLPCNIYPIRNTQRRLQFLKPFLKPRHEVLTRGSCNAYVFWNFNWLFTDPYTIEKISIDRKTLEAFVHYRKPDNSAQCTIYELQKNQWREIKTIKINKNMEVEFLSENRLRFVVCSVLTGLGLLIGLLLFRNRKKKKLRKDRGLKC